MEWLLTGRTGAGRWNGWERAEMKAASWTGGMKFPGQTGRNAEELECLRVNCIVRVTWRLATWLGSVNVFVIG